MCKIDNNFKVIIKPFREKLGLTKSELSDIAGVTRSAIIEIEKGTRIPGAIILYKLSRALQCSIDDLIKVN